MNSSVKPTTVDEYHAALEGPAAELMAALRTLVREELPQSTEAVKWGAPATLHPSGMILLVCSAHRKQVNFTVTPSTREAFAEELADYETGKGSVQLVYGTPPPTDLLRRMIAYRLREYEDDGVTWR